MRLIGLPNSPEEIVECLAARRYELGITQRAIDQIAGLADGHTSKIECGTKRLGDISLPALLATLGLRIAIVAEDERLPERTRIHADTAQCAFQRAARRHRARCGATLA